MLELLVTLVIISFLMAVGVPSFQGAMRGNRLTTSINELSTALSIARSEAVKRNRRVVISKTGANWEDGWQIFVDINPATTDTKYVLDGPGDEAACLAGNDCLLKQHEALPSGFTLRSNRDYVGYRPTGVLSSSRGSFYLCDTHSSSTPAPGTAKALIFYSTGRPRMAPDTNHDGIPEDSGTNITSCQP